MKEKRVYTPYIIKASYAVGELYHTYRKADLHLHTNQTDGTLTPEDTVNKAIATGIAAIAITDHNTIAPSEIALDYATQKELPIEVVRGVEVSSRDGHVLALGVTHVVERGMMLEDTIQAIHLQNGLAIIPHPGLKSASSVNLGLLNDLIKSPDDNMYLDGIEILNATEMMLRRFDKLGIASRKSDSEMEEFLKLHKDNFKLGSLVGNTDAHAKDLGYGISLYTEDSIIEALRNRTTLPMRAATTLISDFNYSLRMAYSVIISHLAGRI